MAPRYAGRDAGSVTFITGRLVGGRERALRQRMQAFDLGVGVKIYLADRWAVRVDMRDNIYTLDLLGKRDMTQNVELNAGLSFLF